MSDHSDDTPLNVGFDEKSHKNADPMTSGERLRKGADVMDALDTIAEKAQKNGLTEDVLEDILGDFYDEKYGKDRVKRDG